MNSGGLESYGRYGTSARGVTRAGPSGNDLFAASDRGDSGVEKGIAQSSSKSLPVADARESMLEKQRQLAEERRRQRLAGGVGIALPPTAAATAAAQRSRVPTSLSAPRGIDPLEPASSVFDRESYPVLREAITAAAATSNSNPGTTMGYGATQIGGAMHTLPPQQRPHVVEQAPPAVAVSTSVGGGALAQAVKERERRALQDAAAESAIAVGSGGAAHARASPAIGELSTARLGTGAGAASNLSSRSRDLSTDRTDSSDEPTDVHAKASSRDRSARSVTEQQQQLSSPPANTIASAAAASSRGQNGASSLGNHRNPRSISGTISGTADGSSETADSRGSHSARSAVTGTTARADSDRENMLVAPFACREPNGAPGESLSARISRGVADPPTQLDFSNMRIFLSSPLPKSAGPVQCYIERERGGIASRFRPIYSLCLHAGDKFLLAGQKRSGNKTSNYIISMDKRDMGRDSAAFIGKVRSNFVGTEYTVYDDGESPDKMEKDGSSGREVVRQELAVVTYASNVLGSRGPRKMKVAVPRVRKDGTLAVFQPSTAGESDSMIEMFKAGHTQNMALLINKPPKWNDEVNAYVLNFNGRVTQASVKNFQLVSPDDHETLVLQFGRSGKEYFTMDLQWPLSPLQSFAIALTSFDYKLACE